MTSVVPTVAIGMTTAPRRVPTLHRALTSLRQAGFFEVVHVFAEPGSQQPLHPPGEQHLEAHWNKRKRGCFGNWERALRYLLSHTDAPWILIVQDDAVWSAGSANLLRAGLRDQQDRRTGFLSSYVVEKDVPAGAVDGWNECRSGWEFWGALALCLSRRSAEKLQRHPRFTGHRSAQQVDALVAQSMLDLRRPSYVHVPSLVDHVGETSTLGHDTVLAQTRGYRFGE